MVKDMCYVWILLYCILYRMYVKQRLTINNTVDIYITTVFFFSVKIWFACEEIDSLILFFRLPSYRTNFVFCVFFFLFSLLKFLFLKFFFVFFSSHCRIYTIQLHRANKKKQTKRKTCDVMLLRPDRKLDCSQFQFDPEREFRFFCAIIFSVEAHIKCT